jgi:hypothetical protein
MSNLSKILRTETEAICYPDGRMVGSDGHEKARLHLKSRLQQIGCRPYAGRSLELPYEFKGKSFCNLVGRLPGTDRRLSPILIGAHYDSIIPFPCADDNAAAVAIALQAGRLIAEKGGLERDVVIAIFDAEEPPYYLSEGMGSNRFYEDHVVGKSEIHAAVIMDLVGHDISVPAKMLELVPGIGGFLKLIPGLSKKDISAPLLSSVMFVTGSESHEDLPGVLDAIGQPSHLRVIPTLNNYIGDVSDHGVFRRNGVPYYFLSCGQWAHYHMPTDTPDRLNYDKMAAITNYVIQMMKSLDQCILGGRTGLENIHETIELESAFMRDALGILYHPAMKWAGLDEVNTRPKMDKFVRHLLSKGTAAL